MVYSNVETHVLRDQMYNGFCKLKGRDRKVGVFSVYSRVNRVNSAVNVGGVRRSCLRGGTYAYKNGKDVSFNCGFPEKLSMLTNVLKLVCGINARLAIAVFIDQVIVWRPTAATVALGELFKSVSKYHRKKASTHDSA